MLNSDPKTDTTPKTWRELNAETHARGRLNLDRARARLAAAPSTAPSAGRTWTLADAEADRDRSIEDALLVKAYGVDGIEEMKAQGVSRADMLHVAKLFRRS